MSSASSSLRLSSGKGGAEASNAVCNSTIETAFSPENYHEFDKNLRRETEKAYLWAATKKYAEKSPALAGCTIESCLADDSGMPVPESEQFLEYFSNVNARREMTKYNVEFEIAPVRVGEDAFADMYESLENNRRAASRCADMVGARASLFGILPSFTETHFSSDMITDVLHFRTLERQLRMLNKNRPFLVNIGYGEGIYFEADNLGVEGAANSLQIRLSVEEPLSAAFYNAAQLVSFIMVGACANSPFLMGRRLWEETRVPLFEQIMYERYVGKNADTLQFGRRCGDVFGHDYLKGSILDLFGVNCGMSAVLPTVHDTPVAAMTHLILHNRDILRWNRPIMEFDEDKNPSLYIESRVTPAGPTTIDMTANVAFFVGLVYYFHRDFLEEHEDIAKKNMPLSNVRRNFYRAARDGFSAEIFWLGKSINLREFILKWAMQYAFEGLQLAGIAHEEAKFWLRIINQRTQRGQNGSVWQRRYVAVNGGDEQGMRDMVRAYRDKQEEGDPVHTWKL